jgi:hypothetical protein
VLQTKVEKRNQGKIGAHTLASTSNLIMPYHSGRPTRRIYL